MSAPVRALGVLVAFVTIVGGLGTVLTGVVWLDGFRLERHVSRQVAVGSAPAVTVRATGADVQVLAGPPGTVSVRQDVAAVGLTRGIAEQAVGTLTAAISATNAGDAVVVSADRPCCFTSAVATEARDTVVVRVPATATLRVTTASGNVDVEALSGTMDVATDSGDVTLTDVTAGHVVRVRTVSGGLTFSGLLRGGSLDLASNSGDISLRLPRDTSAHLNAGTTSGNITVDPIWPVAHDEKLAIGVLGQQPDGSIQLATVSGNISISAR